MLAMNRRKSDSGIPTGLFSIRPQGLAFLSEEALGSAGIARILNKDVGRAASGMPVMLTKITEEDWEIVLEVFDASQPERGEPGHDDRKFPEALHFRAADAMRSWTCIRLSASGPRHLPLPCGVADRRPVRRWPRGARHQAQTRRHKLEFGRSCLDLRLFRHLGSSSVLARLAVE